MLGSPLTFANALPGRQISPLFADIRNLIVTRVLQMGEGGHYCFLTFCFVHIASSDCAGQFISHSVWLSRLQPFVCLMCPLKFARLTVLRIQLGQIREQSLGGSIEWFTCFKACCSITFPSHDCHWWFKCYLCCPPSYVCQRYYFFIPVFNQSGLGAQSIKSFPDCHIPNRPFLT